MALVLSRREKEGIRLAIPPSASGTLITLHVKRFRGKKCHLAFTAPDDVTIMRLELEGRPELHIQKPNECPGGGPA